MKHSPKKYLSEKLKYLQLLGSLTQSLRGLKLMHMHAQDALGQRHYRKTKRSSLLV